MQFHVATILHFFSTYSSLGGVESILRLHAARDLEEGIDSAMAVACEKNPAPPNPASIPLVGLGIRGWHRISHLRNRFSQTLADLRPHTVVFHNAWACRHLVDLAGPARCVLMIHTDSGTSRRAIEKCAPFADGILCVSRPIADHARTLIPSDRVITLAYPISPPQDFPPLPAFSDNPSKIPVIGYAGRLVQEQKCVERLIPLLSALKKSGQPFRFEAVGEGSSLESLRAGLNPVCENLFHGRLKGSALWQTLRSWDFIVFTSDYEGTPISLLEAMSQGVVPIYPEIESGGDDLIRKVDPSLLYPSRDYARAAEAFVRVIKMEPEAKDALRQKLIASVASNRPENYLRQFRTALETLPPFPRRFPGPSELSRFPLGLLPFAVIRRISADTIY